MPFDFCATYGCLNERRVEIRSQSRQDVHKESSVMSIMLNTETPKVGMEFLHSVAGFCKLNKKLMKH